MWLYKNKPLETIEDIQEVAPEAIGFVYLIRVKKTNQYYVGRKFIYSTTKKPPLKGKTRKRKVVKESDWKTYHGSSEEMKFLLGELGPEGFEREIIHFGSTKSELNYLESREIFVRDALLRPNFVNKWITVRINAGNLKGLFIVDNESRDLS